ncbi:unnamed protein product [Notodromas monacha]|uniref:Uncharacterized protein n=1 Tax=Notodromas monacha TaxID=399045 RepID=A0A7R9BVE1_9CRUS|nr:unnamed protein product [Notodromas monacha]CAG0922464.1 unnamed protein product [Notodromas monacha]
MRSRYPKALKNFEENADLLSTPFDVHETLADILHFKSLDFDTKIEDDDGSMPRGISLFRRVPRGRTCTDAAIEAHWCACLQWEPLETESNQARDVANAVLKVINEYNAQQLTQFRATPGVEQDMCAIWQLAKVVWATRFASNSKILQFSKTKDADHFHAKLDASTKPAVEIYQISLTAEPGNGQFEATAHFNVENKSYKIEISHVSRINKYGTQAGCVVDQLHQLRQFCNCLKG